MKENENSKKLSKKNMNILNMANELYGGVLISTYISGVIVFLYILRKEVIIVNVALSQYNSLKMISWHFFDCSEREHLKILIVSYMLFLIL